MESKDTVTATFDRTSEVKALEQMKTGVKGLVDSGISQTPRIFYDPEASVSSNPKPSSPVTIPTIDLEGGVFESTATRESVIAKVKHAMEKFGFFRAINHGVPLDTMEKMEAGIRGFHEQDPEVRKAFYTRGKANTNAAASWRETLSCFMAPDVPKAEDLPEICGEIMLEYSKQVKKLAELILELSSEALGLNPNHLKDMDCAKGLLMLCLCYPYCPDPTLAPRKHTDRTFITILLQDHIGGLDVQHDGGWVPVPPTPGSLIVNVGDLLQLITNDRFVSAEHKVLANKVKEPRISVSAFFVHPPTSSRLYGPIKELLSEENPPKYRETTAQFSNPLTNANASLQQLKI